MLKHIEQMGCTITCPARSTAKCLVIVKSGETMDGFPGGKASNWWMLLLFVIVIGLLLYDIVAR